MKTPATLFATAFLLLFMQVPARAEDAINAPAEAATSEHTQPQDDDIAAAYAQANRIVKIGKAKEMAAFRLNDVAVFYMYQEKDHATATTLFNLSEDLMKDIGQLYGLEMVAFNRAILLNEQKKTPEACEAMQKVAANTRDMMHDSRYAKASPMLTKRALGFMKKHCGAGT